uniref:Uncharacterized protein n=1 Tax=Oryza nivara TaxID=4536 RepID=A0A0E0I3R5_ORYNI
MTSGMEPIDDLEWEEVSSINNYALFMGHMSMAVKGLGYLLVLWTTVILLGGFVSILGKKDFWCLTIITLVQTAGVSDIFLNEKLRYTWRSFLGFFSATDTLETERGAISWFYGRSRSRSYYLNNLVVVVIWLLHLFVFATIICPLAVLYMFGLIITTAISACRLIQHDYRGEVNNGGANLKSALKFVYSIALLQGVLFCYRFTLCYEQKRLVDLVVNKYRFVTSLSESVMAYMQETMIGCEKDPSFVKGRNLVTYAVGLTKSGSPDGFLSGVRILDSLLNTPMYKYNFFLEVEVEVEEQKAMVKQLLLSASYSQDGGLHTLLQSLDCTRAYNAEAREHAARIVAHLAGDLHLEQFPQGIHCIASLLEGPPKDCDGNIPVNYRELMLQGLSILMKLAAHEDCQRSINKTEGLLAKIMAPLRSGLLNHNDDPNSAWFRTVHASMVVILRLVDAPGQTGKELRRKISGDVEAMASMERILGCQGCGLGSFHDSSLFMQALDIYTRMHEHTLSNIVTREYFIEKLLLIFTHKVYKEANIIFGLAVVGEKLATLCSHGKANAKLILQVKDDVVGDLTKILVQDRYPKEYRISTAQILEQLCVHHTDDDEYIQSLKEALKVKSPEVLVRTLRAESVDRQMLAAVLSLIVTMTRNLMDAEDLPPLIDAINRAANGFSILTELQSMVTKLSMKSKVTIVNRLNTLKLITEIFILIVRHGSRYTVEEAENLIKSLLKAARNMSEIEDIMVISGCSSSLKTLGSLVKEAEELLPRARASEMEVIIEHPSCVNRNQIN